MLWSKDSQCYEHPFQSEKELEDAIVEVSGVFFGEQRIYLDTKKIIGQKGKTQNIPDGYLLDLSSKKEPKLYVVENELAAHDPLKHIAVQILEFSLSFETSPFRVKSIIKGAITANIPALSKCQQYVSENGFDNVDVLLERLIYGSDSFNALVIIDELSEELEKVLISRFQFPVEILTLRRFRSEDGKIFYQFDPFLRDIAEPGPKGNKSVTISTDPSELDTIVVPAQEDGFNETFLGENCWYAIRIHASMIPKIKHIAAYQVAPVSAITHVADVASIDQWNDSNKYIVKFSKPAEPIGPLQLVPKGNVKAPQAPRYASMTKLQAAKNLDEAF